MLVNELCDVAMLQSLLLFTRGCSFSRIARPHSHFYTIMPNNVRGVCQSQSVYVCEVTVCVCVQRA